jgi:hypothetical protein
MNEFETDTRQAYNEKRKSELEQDLGRLYGSNDDLSGRGYEVSTQIAKLNREYRSITGRNYEHKNGEEE